MKAGLIRLLSIEELTDADPNLPAYVEPLVEQINPFIKKVATALEKNLSFQHNIQSSEINIEVPHDEEVVVSAKSDKLKVSAVIPGYFNGASYSSFAWDYADDDQISIKIKFEDEQPHQCTFIIILKE